MASCDTLEITLKHPEEDSLNYYETIEIPTSLHDDLAILIGFGIAYENDYIPQSIEIAIVRNKIDGHVVLYEGF